MIFANFCVLTACEVGDRGLGFKTPSRRWEHVPIPVLPSIGQTITLAPNDEFYGVKGKVVSTSWVVLPTGKDDQCPVPVDIHVEIIVQVSDEVAKDIPDEWPDQRKNKPKK